LDTGDENTADLEFPGPIDHVCCAFHGIRVIVTWRIVAYCDNIRPELE
jgi:hypothetical protein